MDIIDQLYNSHVSAATLDALDKYRIHKDQALHGYHALKEQLTDDQAAALEQIMDENLMGTYKIYLKKAMGRFLNLGSALFRLLIRPISHFYSSDG